MEPACRAGPALLHASLLFVGCFRRWPVSIGGLFPFVAYFEPQSLASDCQSVLLQPYVPVFWYPWGKQQMVEAAMSSRRSLNPHMQQMLQQASQKKLNNGARQQAAPMNGGAAAPMNGGNGTTIV